jgi:hypothetical protein
VSHLVGNSAYRKVSRWLDACAYPSVFFAGFLETLPPATSMFEKTTSVELATKLYHCGLYLNLRSEMLPPWRPIVPKRIGRKI